MPDRRPIKRAHERAVVRQFLLWLNETQPACYQVVDEPDPPDAVIESSALRTWVEIGDVFWNDAYAKSFLSFATPGELHKPVPRGPYSNVDWEFATRFVSVLRGKLENTSYEPFCGTYGQGYLVLCIYHPWFDETTRHAMQQHWSTTQPQVRDLRCFREVFLYLYHRDNTIFRWDDFRLTPQRL